MLMAVTLSPEIFVPPQLDDLALKLHYGLLVTLLRDLFENGVILVDADGAITGLIAANVDLWPVRFRKPLKELLGRLRLRSRFAKVEPCDACDQCELAGCALASAIALSHGPRAAVVRDECLTCLALRGCHAECVSITDYPGSAFAEDLRQATVFTIRHGEWSLSDFERKVLQPLFHSAKHVKLVDRYIGRSLLGEFGRYKGLRQDYRESVEHVLKVFAKYRARGGEPLFEVYCGIEASNYAPAAIDEVRKGLKAWAETMSATFAVKTQVILKHERAGAQMPHARWLLTNQAALLVERGFDLLQSDTEMRTAGFDPRRDERRLRDVVLSLCGDPRPVQEPILQLATI
jgi:hypothetical protein